MHAPTPRSIAQSEGGSPSVRSNARPKMLPEPTHSEVIKHLNAEKNAYKKVG